VEVNDISLYLGSADKKIIEWDLEVNLTFNGRVFHLGLLICLDWRKNPRMGNPGLD
jgi:hypothetical protein